MFICVYSGGLIGARECQSLFLQPHPSYRRGGACFLIGAHLQTTCVYMEISEVDENYLSPGSDQELLFVDHNDKTSHKNSADVSVSEEEAANTVGTLTTIHSASSGGTAAERQSKVTLKREITAFSGVFVVINQFIGSGIFITQSGILNYAGSFGVSLLCWVFGGTVALAGAMCYLELGLLVRKTGGEYAILLEAYSFRKKNRWVEMLGSLVSFLYTWTNVLLLRGVAVSIITMTCARYLTRPFFIGCEVPEAAVKLIALAIMRKLAT